MPLEDYWTVTTNTEDIIDHKVILELQKRNPTKGVFAVIETKEDLVPAINVFISMGVPITEEIKDVIMDIYLKEEILLFSNTNLYLGTNDDNVFVIGNYEYTRGLNMCNLIVIRNETEYRSAVIEYDAIICETKEMARVFLSMAKSYGYKQQNGEEWIDSSDSFEYPSGKETSYDLSRGLIVYSENTCYFPYAQKVLYSIDGSLYKFALPDGHIDYSQLEYGKIYKRFLVNSDATILFKYVQRDTNVNRDYIYYDCMTRRGEYILRALCIENRDYKESFVLATTEERRAFRVSILRYEEHLIIERAVIRGSYLLERKEKLFNNKNNIDNYNRDVETQLFSESLHKILTKALDNKVARCLLKINKMGYLNGSTRNITIRRTDKLMTYMPSGKKTEMTEEGNWLTKGRQDGKYGKVIRKILKEQVPRLKFTDYEIEQLVNHLKAESAEGDFKTVKGDDILDWYNGSCYADDEMTGTLGSSCMRDDDCREFMRIYSENPDNVKMVILVKDGELVGRSIIWDDKWMDRIYGTDSTIKAFKNFAKEKGYHCKGTQGSCADDGWINPDTGKYYEESVVINLKRTDFDRYPYADTLYYIDVENGKVSNYSSSLSGYSEMRDTGGYLEGGGLIYDEYTGEDIQEEDSVYIDNNGYSTHFDNVSSCEIDGAYYLNDDMVRTWDDRVVFDGNVVYVSNEDSYAEENEIYICEQDENEYIEGLHSNVYIEELSMTVMEENVTDAYDDNDYHHVGGEWKTREDLKTKGYSEIDGQWIYEESNDETINV